MKLHVLGRGGGAPGPGGGCAGYLVEAANARLMLDCGPGTVGRLLAVCPLARLDAVVLSHVHADHMLDLIPLAYALMIRCLTTEPDLPLKRVPVFVPRGTAETVRAVSRALGHPDWSFPPVAGAAPAYTDFRQAAAADPGTPPDFVFGLLPLTEYDPGDRLPLAGLAIATFAVEHGVPAAAIRVAAEGAVLAYSGDTRPCPGLAAAAAKADLFLCEATTVPDKVPFYANHLTPREAGIAAREADARSLLLTHITPGTDEAWLAATAAAAFGGPVRVAQEGEVIDIERRREDGT